MYEAYLAIKWFKKIWNYSVKRVIDVLLGITGLTIVLPLWIIIGIAIRLDSPGPVFYCQRRLGKQGRPFRLIKLRTMVHNTESISGPIWSYQKDERITRIGRFLRRWHIDETPQFINVLLGHMSIVGPRPEREEIVNKLHCLIPHYQERLQVKPGITGLSQIHLGYDSCIQDVRRKVRYDLLYIKKMCAYLDMKILYLTIIYVIQEKECY